MSYEYSTIQWNFPHSTCELTRPDLPVLQPYSFGINALNTLLLIRTATQARTNESKAAIASFILFELIHMMSHYMHYDKNIHEIGIHACGYLMAYTVYFALKRETGYSLSKYQKAKIFLASIIDIIVFSSIRNLYSIATGLSVLGTVVLQYLPKLSVTKQNTMKILVFGTAILFIMFAVERQYCQEFLNMNFYYHAWVIEWWGLFLFQLLAGFLISDAIKPAKTEF